MNTFKKSFLFLFLTMTRDLFKENVFFSFFPTFYILNSKEKEEVFAAEKRRGEGFCAMFLCWLSLFVFSLFFFSPPVFFIVFSFSLPLCDDDPIHPSLFFLYSFQRKYSSRI